jgi:hypothetical protein
MVSVVFSKNNRPKQRIALQRVTKNQKSGNYPPPPLLLLSGEYPPEAAAPYHAKSSAAGNLSNEDQFSTVKTSVVDPPITAESSSEFSVKVEKATISYYGSI